MSCLIKSRSVSLQSSTCFRFTELQVPERIFPWDARRRTKGVYCYSQGNKTGRRNERVGNGGGFSSLATLLQQRLAAEEKKSPASKKVVKGELNQRSISTGKNSLDQVRTREKKVVREEYPGSIATADTSLHEAVPKENHQPLTKEEQAFSEAVLAALKESALERQREQRRRSNSRKGKRPSERTLVEEKRIQVEDVKPLAIKPEWRGMIASLENKLDKLKQDYYNRV